MSATAGAAPAGGTRIFWGLFGVLLVPLFVLAYLQTVPAEDAVILYDYSKNLIASGVITYGHHTTPIEGATDFLWMMAVSVMARTGLSEFGATLVLNFAAAGLLAALFRDTRDRWILAVALLVTPFLYASLSGFSAITFSAVFVLAISLTLNDSVYVYPCVLVLCLIRPDGAVWGAGCVLYRLTSAVQASRSRSNETRWLLLTLIVPGLGYFFWRAWYFSEWLPLPFLVKSTANRSALLFRSLSVETCLLVAAPAAFVAIAVARRADVKALLVFFALPMAFYATLWLEQNIGNRFMAPMFFGVLYLFCRQSGHRAALAFVAASVFLNADYTSKTVLALIDSHRETVPRIAQELRPFHGRMLVTEAGRLAYYTDWLVEDSWGLNTPRFAHAPISYDDIAAGQYDLVVAHCDLTMLDAEPDFTRVAARSWANQCRAITSFVTAQHYTVLLTPAVDAGLPAAARVLSALGKTATVSPCERYDIYAISAAYANRADVERILRAHRAVPYSRDIRKAGDDIACVDPAAPASGSQR